MKDAEQLFSPRYTHTHTKQIHEVFSENGLNIDTGWYKILPFLWGCVYLQQVCGMLSINQQQCFSKCPYPELGTNPKEAKMLSLLWWCEQHFKNIQNWKKTHQSYLHPGRLTWNLKMMVWKIIFLSKWVICRFHVNFPGCIGLKGWVAHPLVVVILIRGDMRWYSV